MNRFIQICMGIVCIQYTYWILLNIFCLHIRCSSDAIDALKLIRNRKKIFFFHPDTQIFLQMVTIRYKNMKFLTKCSIYMNIFMFWMNFSNDKLKKIVNVRSFFLCSSTLHDIMCSLKILLPPHSLCLILNTNGILIENVTRIFNSIFIRKKQFKINVKDDLFR